MPRVAPIRPARELKSDADDATRAPADLVNELATELNLLSESRMNPDAFLERRDFLVKRLRRLAKRLGKEPSRAAPGFVCAGVFTPLPRVQSPERQASRRSGSRPILTLKGSHAARD